MWESDTIYFINKCMWKISLNENKQDYLFEDIYNVVKEMDLTTKDTKNHE